MTLRDNDSAAGGVHWGGVLAWCGWGCGLLALSVWVWHRLA
ncbi:hypothetical protein [Solimonas flava]|nr:hypothetical protein [Solimonas flava]